MESSEGTSLIVPLLFLCVTAMYAAVYYAAKWVTARVTHADKDAGPPRWAGLAALLVTAWLTTSWMYTTFVDPEVYASLDPFMQGQYKGQATGPAVVPAVVAGFVILVKIWRARQRRRERAREEQARNRTSPKW